MQSSPSDFPLKEGTGFSKIQSPALPEQAEGVEHPAGFSPGSEDLSKLPVPIHLLMSIPAVLGACGPCTVPGVLLTYGMFSMQNGFFKK